jgi:alpha-amylase
MAVCTNSELQKDWNYLQVSDHFYYMSTKFFSSGESHSYVNPFDSPYEAFINYMNVLSDFKMRLNAITPGNEQEQEVSELHKLIALKDQKIKKMEAELQRIHKLKPRKKQTGKKN